MEYTSHAVQEELLENAEGICRDTQYTALGVQVLSIDQDIIGSYLSGNSHL